MRARPDTWIWHAQSKQCGFHSVWHLTKLCVDGLQRGLCCASHCIEVVKGASAVLKPFF